MEKQDINIKKYPKSKHKFQCIGPCYYPNTIILHPTRLELTTFDQPFCPVDVFQVDQKTGKNINLITDICFNPTDKENISNKESDLNSLIPYIDFNFEYFLKIYYNIFSFEDSIDWIYKNNHVPIETKIRIIKSSLNVFGENIDLVDTRFEDFFIEYIKKIKIQQIYNKLHHYIVINKDTNTIYFITKEQNKLKKTYNCIERINYLINVFLDKKEITKFLLKYFKHRKSQWNEIPNHLDNMSLDLTNYILNKIMITLQQAK